MDNDGCKTRFFCCKGKTICTYVLYFLTPRPNIFQYPSHSDSSLATGSSEGSLQTTLEEGLSFSVSPPQNLGFSLPAVPVPLVCPLQLPEDSTTISSPVRTLRPRLNPSSSRTLRATMGHQRSQSSGRGSTSPGYTRDDSIDPSDEDLGIVIGSSIGGCGSSQAGNSEHLSETMSSLSLTSLLSPNSLVSSGGAVKKCNSTGSLEQGGMLLASRGREARREILGLKLRDSQGFLANPWTGIHADARRGEGRGEIGDSEKGWGKSSSQTTLGPCRENRWSLMYPLYVLPFLGSKPITAPLCLSATTSEREAWNMMYSPSNPFLTLVTSRPLLCYLPQGLSCSLLVRNLLAKLKFIRWRLKNLNLCVG